MLAGLSILSMVTAAGIDPIRFGICPVLMVEMSQIAPRLGFDLFVIQTITGRDIFAVARYAVPFFPILVPATASLAPVPRIALWLPGTMLSR
ncbi:MAG: TRAP transporter large permease subunit [Rhodosalinus sp.]|uniref:TRAP transporter large permease subunit n=1 Tax=Rhodosalinus sp. TaxID=2047741 RepID=UPI00397CE437